MVQVMYELWQKSVLAIHTFGQYFGAILWGNTFGDFFSNASGHPVSVFKTL
jgi:hypothetical protein